MIEDEAGNWVQLHGRRAPQLLVDQLVQAIRKGDEARITYIDALRKRVDHMLEPGRSH